MASEKLIAHIGRMIACQEKKTRSPLNDLAAKWADEHLRDLLIDRQVVAPTDQE